MAYLKEAASWNPDGNFDRISAMGMLMILREDRLKYQSKKRSEEVEALFKDPFFSRQGFSSKKDYAMVYKKF